MIGQLHRKPEDFEEIGIIFDAGDAVLKDDGGMPDV